MYVINAVLSRLVFGDQILLVKEVCTTCSKELRNVKDCLCSANYSEITLDVRNYFQKSKKGRENSKWCNDCVSKLLCVSITVRCLDSCIFVNNKTKFLK